MEDNKSPETWRVLEDVPANLPVTINGLIPYGIRPDPKIDADGVKIDTDGVIEGEYGTVATLSGFSCNRCFAPLPVGGTSCPSCHRQFVVVTPDRYKMPSGMSDSEMRARWRILVERIIDEEVDKKREFLMMMAKEQSAKRR